MGANRVVKVEEGVIRLTSHPNMINAYWLSPSNHLSRNKGALLTADPTTPGAGCRLLTFLRAEKREEEHLLSRLP
ncbi:hypothetical protein CAEBREN_32488 [Caenorhabditis brenneri]|uniref:Uncharacterized protein n=1 Tax=Caenorhabditis brenneri TaxID=135651 RepID=G0MFH9_CAEBE|nr:hypothetical protein CAEBREN_32488 [Caenorhabditis brenneri]